MNNAIKLDKLTKHYGKNRGISDISFQVKTGEIFGFIGPNGAGKSTTIRTMLGLLFSTSGEIEIFGLPFKAHREQILERVGYAAAEIEYYESMRGRAFLEYAASFYKVDCQAEMVRLTRLFELDLDKKIGDMSLGNKKKVGLIQAMQHRPELLILDEPTAGLDPLVQQKLFDELNAFRRRGATVLFSSHVLSEVERLCDRVAIIRNGKLIQVSTLVELQQSQYLQVSMTTKEEKVVVPESFAVSEVEIQDNHIRFIYKGDVNLLISFVNQFNLATLKIQEPDLEKVFMHFYDGAESKAGE